MNNKQLKNIRISAASFYFVMGLIFASWASRIQNVKAICKQHDKVI